MRKDYQAVPKRLIRNRLSPLMENSSETDIKKTSLKVFTISITSSSGKNKTTIESNVKLEDTSADFNTLNYIEES